ncbi:MMPL family transporter [Streptomyces sp. RFCAC02]|uniref:MMPL family transporter n=1 Tax=Streptomyces sp. RFCAC02 TaxID=2499143 RepID=UPI001020008C|nr:MMPL family transporter [Streptomyces sp. RFCAC02]
MPDKRPAPRPADRTPFWLRHRRAILVVAVLLALLGGTAGATVFDRMKGGGFDDPGAESGRAAAELAERFGQDDPNLVLLVHADDGVDAPAAARAGAALSDRLAAEEGVTAVTSYWMAGAPDRLRSRDGSAALVLAALAGDDTEAAERLDTLEPAYAGRHDGGIDVEFGGPAVIGRELGEASERDAVRGEMIAFPLMLVVLVIIFGGLVAAALPLVTGLITILLSFGLLWALAGVTDVSVFAVNVVTLLGLGLAVDYSLLMVNRYREEIAAGHEPAEAIRRTMRSAGRTVVFSAVTVAVTLAGLAWFPLLALRSMAWAGVAVALLTALVTLLVLPALLAVLGPRVEKGRLWRRRAPADEPGHPGFWHRVASFVMRRPVPVAGIVGAFLLLLGLPFLGISMGTADERTLPASSPARQVAEEMRTGFDSGESQALFTVLPEVTDPTGDEAAAYATAVARLDGVARVDTAAGSFAAGRRVADPGPGHAAYAAPDGRDGVWLSVVPEPLPTEDAEALVREIRDLPSPGTSLTGGQTAVAMDGIDAITDRLPVAGITLAVAMYVLLFLLTGSVLLPVLAMLLSAIGLTATFGALVWGFQDGHLAGLLDFTSTGSVVGTVPVLLFAVAFGLGMDYQVFLLSRISEEYAAGGDPVAAVAMGLERIGRIVTAAAATLSIVFLAFLVSDITFLQALGVCLPLAVLMDATLIRGALLPAAMRLAGHAGWWLPRWLAPVHERFGLRETADAPPAAAPDHEREGAAR